MIGLDLFGKELNIGDKVIYTDYGEECMRTGVIEKQTPKMIYVKGDSWKNMTRITKPEKGQKSYRICKI